MTEKHMIFFQHGLHGTFADYDVMIKNFKERYPDLLLVSGSANGGVKTREGIDKCGERMAHEVTEVSKLLKPTKISIVGHSLGGPISRYAIGILYEQGYFNNVSPIQYISLSSPHCGSRRPQKGAFNVTVSFFTDKCISVTGKQLMLTDNDSNPILLEMSRLDSRYLLGLQLFKNRSLYSTIENDIHVVFNTSNISHQNPYTKQGGTQQRLSLKYPHFIDSDSLAEFKPLTDSDDLAFANDEKGPILREMLKNLQTLTYSRHHMKFDNALSHTHVIMKRESLNSAGKDVILHLMDHLII